MHEQLARTLYYCGVHLLYASLVWVAAWILTAIPRGSATAKYWIWVGAALNFMLPLGALVDRLWSAHFTWARPLGAIGAPLARIANNTTAALLLGAVWLLGAICMAIRLWLRVWSSRRKLRSRNAAPQFVVEGIPVVSGDGPAVAGIVSPRISLPTGIQQLLNRSELEAVLIHEAAHARRRDNLIRLVFEIGLCALWFHPLMWLAGSRLSLYRELSCDERVIRRARGSDLVSALAKLANPSEGVLLEAGASSLLSRRLARLTDDSTKTVTGSSLLLAAFGTILFGGVLETVAHSACCFLARK